MVIGKEIKNILKIKDDHIIEIEDFQIILKNSRKVLKSWSEKTVCDVNRVCYFSHNMLTTHQEVIYYEEFILNKI